MNKETFLAELKSALAGLPQADADERLAFYAEMIDDRVEEGATEGDAVAEIGTVESVVSQIVAETPLAKLVKERIKPKRALRAWEVILIVLGFPLWFPLLVAAGAVILAVYATVWALIVSLWAVEVSFWASALGGLAAAVFCFVQGQGVQGAVLLGTTLFCAGVSIFLFYACVAASKGILKLTKKTALGIKSRFVGRENVK